MLFHSANFEATKKEARKLLHALRMGDAGALERYHSLDPLAGTVEPGLSDIQYVIARRYGCESWRQLKDQIESRYLSLTVKTARES